MKNCKKCIHNKVCERSRSDAEKLGCCGDFKDESKIIELPCKVRNVIDKLFSHNEIVALWYSDKNKRHHNLLWRGMAWDIPQMYLTMPFIKIFGTVPEKISESDTINIEIDTPRETAEQALKEREQ